jgi:hypothetical protein
VVNQPEKHRVILVSPDGSPMQFGIRVTDLGAARPAAAAISATTVSNQPLLPQDLKIRIEN